MYKFFKDFTSQKKNSSQNTPNTTYFMKNQLNLIQTDKNIRQCKVQGNLTNQSSCQNDNIFLKAQHKPNFCQSQKQFFTRNSKITIFNQQFRILKLSTGGKYMDNFKREANQVGSQNCHFAICKKLLKSKRIEGHQQNQHHLKECSLIDSLSEQIISQSELQRRLPLYFIIFELILNSSDLNLQIKTLYCQRMPKMSIWVQQNFEIKQFQDLGTNQLVQCLKLVQKKFNNNNLTFQISDFSINQNLFGIIMEYRFKSYEDLLAIKFFIIDFLKLFFKSNEYIRIKQNLNRIREQKKRSKQIDGLKQVQYMRKLRQSSQLQQIQETKQKIILQSLPMEEDQRQNRQQCRKIDLKNCENRLSVAELQNHFAKEQISNVQEQLMINQNDRVQPSQTFIKNFTLPIHSITHQMQVQTQICKLIPVNITLYQQNKLNPLPIKSKLSSGQKLVSFYQIIKRDQSQKLNTRSNITSMQKENDLKDHSFSVLNEQEQQNKPLIINYRNHQQMKSYSQNNNSAEQPQKIQVHRMSSQKNKSLSQQQQLEEQSNFYDNLKSTTNTTLKQNEMKHYYHDFRYFSQMQPEIKQNSAYQSQLTTANIFDSQIGQYNQLMEDEQIQQKKNFQPNYKMETELVPKRLDFDFSEKDKIDPSKSLEEQNNQQSFFQKKYKLDQEDNFQNGYLSQDQSSGKNIFQSDRQQNELNQRDKSNFISYQLKNSISQAYYSKQLIKNNLDAYQKAKKQSNLQILDCQIKKKSQKQIERDLSISNTHQMKSPMKQQQFISRQFKVTYILIKDNINGSLYLQIGEQQINQSVCGSKQALSKHKSKLVIYNSLILQSYRSKQKLYNDAQFLNHLNRINALEINSNLQHKILLYSTYKQSHHIVLQFDLKMEVFTAKYHIPSHYSKLEQKQRSLPLKQVKYQFKDNSNSFFTLNDKQICFLNVDKAKNYQSSFKIVSLNKVFTYKMTEANQNIIFDYFNIHQNGTSLIVGVNGDQIKVLNLGPYLTRDQSQKHCFQNQNININSLSKAKNRLKLNQHDLNCVKIQNQTPKQFKTKQIIKNSHFNSNKTKIKHNNYEAIYLKALNSFNLSDESSIVMTQKKKTKVKQLQNALKSDLKNMKTSFTKLEIVYKAKISDQTIDEAEKIYCQLSNNQKYLIDCVQFDGSEQINCFKKRFFLQNRSLIRNITEKQADIALGINLFNQQKCNLKQHILQNFLSLDD